MPRWPPDNRRDHGAISQDNMCPDNASDCKISVSIWKEAERCGLPYLGTKDAINSLEEVAEAGANAAELGDGVKRHRNLVRSHIVADGEIGSLARLVAFKASLLSLCEAIKA